MIKCECFWQTVSYSSTFTPKKPTFYYVSNFTITYTLLHYLLLKGCVLEYS